MKVFLLFFVVLMNFCILSHAEAPTDNSCVSCHSDMWEEMKGSVHSQHGITCNQCHGGDPTQKDKDLAKAPATGYIGVPDKKQIAQICGNCHANIETMNSYGIRTDQLARYKTSTHGKKILIDGDTKVAVCSDCHGYHDVLPIADPNSPAYPLNVPKTCNHCHGNEKLMTPYGKPADIFDKYKNSVHGKALFEKKDLGVATCISCHGNHGAVPPGVKNVGAACGKCHINEHQNFLEIVHAKITDQEKFHQCIACHGNHDIAPVSLNLYTQACSKCHEPQSHAFQQGQKIWKLFNQAKTDLKETQDLIKQAGIDGLFVDEEMAILEETKTKVFEMGPLQHTLSYEKINALDTQIENNVRKIQSEIHGKRENLKWRKWALWPLWIFILIMSWALWKRYKQLKSSNDH